MPAKWKGTLKERFDLHVHPDPNSGCFIWDGHPTKKGYGSFKVGRNLRLAHRVAYEFEHGPIPAGLQVCHKCDTPCCVNPDHMFLGTNRDNVDDMIRKGRHHRKGALPRGVYRRGDKYRARTGRTWGRKVIGVFETIREAAEAVIAAEKEAC